jgi:hypothetical protein
MTGNTERLFVGISIRTALTDRDAMINFEVRLGVGLITLVAGEVISLQDS